MLAEILDTTRLGVTVLAFSVFAVLVGAFLKGIQDLAHRVVGHQPVARIAPASGRADGPDFSVGGASLHRTSLCL